MTSPAACPRCGSALVGRNPAPFLLAPLVLGLAAAAFAWFAPDRLTTGEVLAIVTAGFVLFILLLGPLARAWLAPSRCKSCGQG